jgi:cytochrome c
MSERGRAMRFKPIQAAWAAPLVLAGLAQQSVGAAPPEADGEALYRQRCQSCHQIAAGKASPMGPNLYGVVDRKAAAAPVPFRYSPALKASGLTWTRETLDKYIAAPTETVPGTRMVIAVADASQRAAIIDYLARAR